MKTSAYLKSQSSPLESRVDALVLQSKPSIPIHILDSNTLFSTAQQFVQQFSGTVMYAVKCNPTKEVIKTIAKAGIRTFDVASIEEVRIIRKWVPHAKIHFMHTVKSRENIREAYFKHGVRVFVIDTADELRKIIHETDLALDLEIYVRLALPKNKDASADFSAKFGAHPVDAIHLLRDARLVSNRLGVMFHPGSQSKNPDVFRTGIKIAADVIRQAGVTVDSIDVGGGFPASYPEQTILPLSAYIQIIHDTIEAEGLSHLDLYCEPGRALVAQSGKLIVRVEQRKKDMLYLNDGVYGGLIEAADYQGGFIYPTRLIRKPDDMRQIDDSVLTAYQFWGPTCDSVDVMKGPFFLPADVVEGDWIEISMTGAYSIACRTQFNGFNQHQTVIL
jgi:ornithine decarboxylase